MWRMEAQSLQVREDSYGYYKGSLEGLILISNVYTLVIQQFYFQMPNLRYQPYMLQGTDTNRLISNILRKKRLSTNKGIFTHLI